MIGKIVKIDTSPSTGGCDIWTAQPVRDKIGLIIQRSTGPHLGCYDVFVPGHYYNNASNGLWPVKPICVREILPKGKVQRKLKRLWKEYKEIRMLRSAMEGTANGL